MRQVLAMLGAIKANPSVTLAVMVTFPLDKVRGLVSDAPEAPWMIQQRLRLPGFFREQGVNLTCIHRPAYYYALHRVDYTAKADIRGGHRAFPDDDTREQCSWNHSTGLPGELGGRA